MDKIFLRREILAKRARISADDRARKGLKITENFFSLADFLKNKIFSSYYPVKNEVETRIIIDRLYGFRKLILLPFYEKDWSFGKFENWDNLEKGFAQILQPRKGGLKGNQIEVAIIPGVAFSKSGVRLGYGKGIFDRLFSNSKAIKVGLGYDFQVVDRLPAKDHDLRMDFIITESKIFKFN